MKSKGKYDSAHLDLDAFSNELSAVSIKSPDNAGKVAQAQDNASRMHETYNAAKAELIAKCEALETKKSMVFHDNMARFLLIQLAALDASLKAATASAQGR